MTPTEREAIVAGIASMMATLGILGVRPKDLMTREQHAALHQFIFGGSFQALRPLGVPGAMVAQTDAGAN